VNRGRTRPALLLGVGAAALAASVAAVARSRATALPPPDWMEHITPDTAGHRGGQGTPILLLHGISVTWRTWKPILPLLEPHHDVIAPTLLGHSGAAAIAEGIAPSLDTLVDGVLAELDTLGLDRVHVVGNSLGGWIALELARRHRARSVVVFSPAGAWRSAARIAAVAGGMRAGFRVMDSFGDALERLAWTPRGRRMLLAAQVEHPERFNPADLVADIRAVRHAPVLGPLSRAITTAPIQPLTDPDCPVRIVWGGSDRVIPFRQHGVPMLERVPGAELVMLDGVGHVPMSDDPDAVARLILEVTESVDRGTVPPVAHADRR
jgi:pimeloyl-ACP methyl ester carboxylesterase